MPAVCQRMMTRDGILTLYDALFQRTCAIVYQRTDSFKLQLGLQSSQI